jgi:hypothetical protein
MRTPTCALAGLLVVGGVIGVGAVNPAAATATAVKQPTVHQPAAHQPGMGIGVMRLEVRNETDRYQEAGKEKTFEVYAENKYTKLAVLRPGQLYRAWTHDAQQAVWVKVDGRFTLKIEANNPTIGTPSATVIWGFQNYGQTNQKQYRLSVGQSADYSYNQRAYWVYRDSDFESMEKDEASGKAYVVSLWRVTEPWVDGSDGPFA